jgi:hypothetical protein
MSYIQRLHRHVIPFGDCELGEETPLEPVFEDGINVLS